MRSATRSSRGTSPAQLALFEMFAPPVPPPLPRSTPSAPGSPVSPSRSRGNAKRAKTRGGSGLTSPGSSVRWDRGTSSWRTCPASSPPTVAEPSVMFSGRWPRSGTMRSGTASAHPTWERPTDVSGGSCWPTATAGDANSSGSAAYSTESGRHSGTTLTDAVVRIQHWPTATVADRKGQTRGANARGGESLSEAARAWPTPRASPNENRQTKLTPSQLAGTHGLSLAASVNHWQTPVAAHRTGTQRSGCPGAPLRPMLAAQVKQESESARPTPTGRDWKSGSASPETLERNARPLSEVMRTQQPGPLNPAWVEALMGLPIDWTLPDGPPVEESPSTRGSRPARPRKSRTVPRG